MMESLIFLAEKKSGEIKARHCANGSTQRDYMSREDVSSPTVMTKSNILTSVIEAEEERDVAICDIPNAFVQTDVERRDKDGNRTIILGEALVCLCCFKMDWLSSPIYFPNSLLLKRVKLNYCPIALTA